MTSAYFNSTVSSGYVVTTDMLTLGPQAYITGPDYAVAATAFTTIDSYGTINGSAIGVFLEDGGAVINRIGGSVAGGFYGILSNDGSTTVVNHGSVHGGAAGVYLRAGGTLTNGSNAQIGGEIAAWIKGDAGTVVNYGTLAGTSAFNTKSIVAGTGVELQSGGDVTNTGSGLIEGKFYGIVLDGAGIVTNDAGAEISGTQTSGVYVDGGDGTVINAGTISGGSYAIEFSGSYSDRVILDPGSTIVGTVAGGSGSNVLELASGSGVGTISGVGTSFTNFGKIQVDGAAAWDLTGTNSIASGGTLTNLGTLTDLGTLTIGSGATVSATGTIFVGGTLINGATITGGPYGVYLQDGAVVINHDAGTIAGEYALFSQSGPVSAVNYGTVAGTGQAHVVGGIAVEFHHGGDVTNASGGLIDGKHSGVLLFAAGTVTNDAGAEINGTANIGVYIGHGDGTVINAGTISGGTYAIQFAGSYSDRVILDPGSVLEGTVVGGSGSNVLELATGSGVGTISGLGTSFAHFGTVQVDSGASWDLTGANSIASGGMLVDRGTLTAGSGASLINFGTIKVNGGVLIDDKPLQGTGTIDITNGGAVNLLSTASQTTIDFEDGGKLELANPSGVSISDFAVGDTIDLTGLSFSTADKVTYNSSLHEIVVYHNGHQTLATLGATDVTGTPILQRDGNGTDIVVCYLRGTRILTEHGEFAVEDLRPGMRVVTLSGRGPALKPVTWIGKRRLNAARHQRPDEVYPVRIMAGALGENTPHRDLLVSPGHAVFVEGVLIPAQRLVNGETIIQDRAVSAVEYFHVELEQHDPLLAEGLAAESYYDSGNRRFFDETGAPVDLHAGPDDERVQAAPRFRLSNAGNGVSDERRRRVERTAGRAVRLTRRAGAPSR